MKFSFIVATRPPDAVWIPCPPCNPAKPFAPFAVANQHRCPRSARDRCSSSKTTGDARLLTEELSDTGFTGRGGATAAAGLDLARVTRIDLIITDLRMPEMDGFDLIRGVMQLPEPPHVVMITAF